MAFNDVVMRAILALDAYNRGTDAKVKVDGYQIGNAALGLNSNNYSYPSGFFAQSYDLNGTTIISYRGTDSFFDIFSGWPTGVGDADTSQATLGIKFYNELIGNSDPRTANVELVGHSMGGGVAGYVASFYGKTATIFDNMAFESAVINAHAYALAHFNNTPYRTADEQYRDEMLYDTIYGNTVPYNPIFGSSSSISAYAASGEVLELNRLLQETPVTTIEDDIWGPLDSHDQALLTILLYGESEAEEWKRFREYLTPHLFDSDIAQATYASTIANGGTSADAAMRHAIAYSSIDDGAKPFGKSGIRALYNDACDIGKIINEGASAIIDISKDPIGKAVVQFAGQIAVAKISDDAMEEGILTLSEDEQTLILDLSDNLWKNNVEGAIPNIVAEAEMKSQYYAMMGSSLGLPGDIRTAMTKLWGKADSSVIDRLAYKVQDGKIDARIDEREYAPSSERPDRKVTLFAAAQDPARVFGHSGDDLLYGSSGDDTLYGLDGDDLLRGGDGDDELYGGYGNDYLIGGAGNDTLIDLSGNDTLDGGAGDDLIIGLEGLSTLIGGAGNDTITGATGNLIEAVGEGIDTIYHGKGLGIKAGSEDYISIYGHKLFGAFAQGTDVTDCNVAFDCSGAIRYMKNKDNEVIIENVLGWQTFLLNYDGGPGIPNPTAHVTVGQMKWKAFKLIDYSYAEIGTTITESVCKILDLGIQTLTGEPSGATDPLVLDLDGDGLELNGLAFGTSPYFDMDGDNFAESTGWVRGDDGLLVHDANGDGQINDISELFGDENTSGFDALSSFDSNGDMVVDALDTNFNALQIWRDLDGDGVTDEGELFSLSEAGVQSISLENTESDTDNNGHTISSVGTFTRTDGTTGEICNVDFVNNDFDTKYLGDSTVSVEAEAQPDLKGQGVLASLRISMTQDPDLLSTIQAISQAAPTTLEGIRQMIIPVLRAWAGDHDSGVSSIPYLYTVNGDSSIEIRDMAIYNSSNDSWSLQSGRDIVDGNGDIIENPTLADIQAMSFSWEDAAWDTFASSDIAFLEQYVGEDLPITPENLLMPGAGSAIEGYLELLYDFQISLGVAFAVQGGLSDFFEDIVYDVEKGRYSSVNEYQLTPLYENILNASPQTDAGAATTYIDNWVPILHIFLQRFSRGASNLANTYSFLFSNLVGAYENVGHGVLSISEAASALTIPHIIEGTGELVGTNENDIFYMGPGDQIAIGGLGPDAYVFGSNFGHDIIDDREPAPGGDDFDAIRFATYKSDEISAERDGNDLILTVTATGDSVRIVEQFLRKRPGLMGGYIDEDRGVNEIVFADGVVWDNLEMARQVCDPQDGDQVYIGTRSTDFLDGGAGNDTLSGKDSLDVYRFGIGSGNDVIHDQMESLLLLDEDYIEFGEGVTFNDLIFERDGDSDDLLIRINGTDDSLTITGQFNASNTEVFGMFWPDRIENLAFSNGTTMRWYEVMHDLIQKAKTDGDDEIFGFHFQDTLDGGAGNDTLHGGNDGDTYIFGRGYGQDVVNDYHSDILTVTPDTVLFKEGITPEDIHLSRDGASSDLTISIEGDDGSLTIIDQFDADVMGPFGTQWLNRIETFKFQDTAETVWTWTDIMDKLIAESSTDGDDEIHGFHRSDVLDGGAGNDTLMGGDLSDIYKYGIGSGNDLIRDIITTILAEDNDRVEFGPGITLADLTVHNADEGNDLVITINSTGETLTIDDQFKLTGVSSMDNRIEEFHFDDGTIMYSHEFGRLTTIGTAGDDIIYGSNCYDTLIGGAGNDTLIGKSYSDIYMIGAGSGHDVIQESVRNIIHPDTDIVKFGEGITPGDVIASRSGDNLVLTINGADSLTVEDCFFTESKEIEEFHFEDGTIWTLSDVQGMILIGTDGDDSLIGFDGRSDILDGGLGNDTLKGEGAADTYVFNVGYGQDVIHENARITVDSIKDKVLFGDGITADNIVLSRSDDDLIFSIAGTSDQLTIQQQFFTEGYEVEEFHFSNGTIWTMDDVQAMLLAGTDGEDTLIGFNDRSDVLDGGLGNDRLEGKGYADTYIFDVGYGQDVIRDYPQILSDTIKDKVVFGAGVTTENIILSQSDGDLIISIAGTSDQLTIEDTLNSSVYRVEEYHFADGTVWTLDDVVTILENTVPPLVPTHVGTSGNDTINGTSGDDIIQGGTGNDYTTGGYGKDLYLFNLGDGQDVIYDSGMNGEVDTLVLGTGLTVADVIVTHSTSDVDDVTLTFSSEDSILLDEQDYGYGKGIDRVEFADGTVWTKTDIAQAYFTQTNTAGNDSIIGFDLLDDTIYCGLGNDSLRGGYGEDTYVFNLGDGQDDIYDHGMNGEMDTLVLGAGLTVADVVVSHSTSDVDDVTLTFSSGDSILLNEQDYGYGTGIDRVEFADGTVWTKTDITQTYLTQAATSGNDTILGFRGNDTISGGAGDDYVRGGSGSDTYHFNLGDGQDNIYDYGSSSDSDRLVFGVGIAITDVALIRTTTDTDDLLLQLSSGDSVLLNEQDFGTTSGIEHIEFADGTDWSYADIQSAYFDQAATSGNDYVIGFKDADDIRGGAGNDTLVGGHGSDTYHFGIGDTYALIYDNGSSSETDVLVLGTGIETTDVAVTWDGADADDIILQLTSGDTIYLDEQDYLSSFGIEQVVFEDGTVWSKSDLVSMANASLAPIILDLDGDGVEFSADQIAFDFDSDGLQETGGWAAADDGFLVLDRNNDGVITSGDELSFVQDSTNSLTDLQGLQAYDSNSDGFLTAEDDDYGRFQIWSDKNQNGVSESNELFGLAQAGLTSLDLSGIPTGPSTLETPGATVLNTTSINWADGSTTTAADTILKFDQDILENRDTLIQSQLQLLVNSMSSFTQNDPGSVNTPCILPDDATPMLTADWQRS
ncbi:MULTISPECIES: calcium-binding protein [unclassified Pseudodesulfovibrio]|uniref:calcium-binding protein n=1 Tax=unclassified Pseudodesulfovibrio TaxID=2661612 RepID=UPI000FEBA35D|nr:MULTISPECIES: calcium-binding protein [unclassified Pseudodesulfovibrio]MCJ2163449.1 hypothetical protein [Pseudodesulfovibrio sp. S3-i]RWU06684.1 hypothetical protein DWB63_02670 [Pseudodesulfovibrio sp. S3]